MEPNYEDLKKKNTISASVPAKQRETVKFSGTEPSTDFAKGMLKGLGYEKVGAINPKTTTSLTNEIKGFGYDESDYYNPKNEKPIKGLVSPKNLTDSQFEFAMDDYYSSDEYMKKSQNEFKEFDEIVSSLLKKYKQGEITPEEEKSLYSGLELYSDYHKEVYGYRPRGWFTEDMEDFWNNYNKKNGLDNLIYNR